MSLKLLVSIFGYLLLWFFIVFVKVNQYFDMTLKIKYLTKEERIENG